MAQSPPALVGVKNERKLKFMQLWRVMSYKELVRYKRGKIVKPRPSSVRGQANSWEKPVVCFFGTANNAVRWANPFAAHEVLVCFEIDQKSVKTGWGKYPDLAAIKSSKLHEVARLTVREYALDTYSRETAKLIKEIGIDYKWIANNSVELSKLMDVNVLPTYDDTIKLFEEE